MMDKMMVYKKGWTKKRMEMMDKKMIGKKRMDDLHRWAGEGLRAVRCSAVVPPDGAQHVLWVVGGVWAELHLHYNVVVLIVTQLHLQGKDDVERSRYTADTKFKFNQNFLQGTIITVH